MAIYRPPKARWPLALGTGAVGLMLGLAIGLLAGRDEVRPVDAARALTTPLIEAAGSLEVAAVEYEEAVSAGTVENETEYDGALDALASSRRAYAEVRTALETLAADLVEQIDAGYDDVEEAMRSQADASEVVSMLGELEDLLKLERA